MRRDKTHPGMMWRLQKVRMHATPLYMLMCAFIYSSFIIISKETMTEYDKQSVLRVGHADRCYYVMPSRRRSMLPRISQVHFSIGCRSNGD